MRALLELVDEVQRLLDDAGLPNMLIGGLAVAAWGEPRLTRDVDFKVRVARAEIDRLVEVLGGCCAPADPGALDFARRSGVLFLKSPAGLRVDLLLAEAGFDEVALARARSVLLFAGVEPRLCSPEDLIIYKLLSDRPRDREDARTVVIRQGDRLDHIYVESTLAQFEVALDDSTLVETYRGLRSWPQVGL